MKIPRSILLVLAVCVLMSLALITIYSLYAQENQRALLPIILAQNFFANGQEFEPNNNFEQANGPISSGTDYSGLPNDSYDIFYFTLYEPGLITMHVTNHQVNGGQMLLYHEENGQIISIGPRDDSPPNYYMSYLAEEPGTYYLFLFVDTAQPYEPNLPYTLNVTYPMPVAETSTPTPNGTSAPLPTATPTNPSIPSATATSIASSSTPNATQLATFTATPSPTSTLPPTATPLIPGTEPVLPAGYLLYDDFDGSTGLPAKWHISGTNNLCDRDQVEGALEIHCETNANNAQITFRPKDANLTTVDGVAIAANVSSSDWQAELGLDLDIFENEVWTRRYTFELGPNSIELVEYYPHNNWQHVSLGIMAPITGADPHVLQIEIESDTIVFSFDGVPVPLQTPPTLPANLSDRTWLFEGYILSTGGLLELDSKLYWSAYAPN
ncbi:MAG: hypothetical protein KDE48_20970 [Anaerolineales bacterium]|nr:hypothetical protein [Anaerolineales bacterium]